VSESNARYVSDLHLKKQRSQITSYEEAIQKQLAWRAPLENSSQSRNIPWITVIHRLNTVEHLNGFWLGYLATCIQEK
jgi:hypothetical protein